MKGKIKLSDRQLECVIGGIDPLIPQDGIDNPDRVPADTGKNIPGGNEDIFNPTRTGGWGF